MLLDSDTPLNRHSYYEASVHRAPALLPLQGQLEADLLVVGAGFVDISMNRAPDFGRVSANVYYLQGFSGHGVAATGLAGRLVAEAIAGQAERFDVFARLKHPRFRAGAGCACRAWCWAWLTTGCAICCKGFGAGAGHQPACRWTHRAAFPTRRRCCCVASWRIAPD